MKRLRILALALLALAAAPRESATDARLDQEVLAAEDARFAAMMKADTTALRPLLADGLRYCHSTGQLETRAQFLASVGSGSMRYLSIVPGPREVLRLGADAAAVSGRAHVRAVHGASELDAEIRYLAVYERNWKRWRLRAWQSARVIPG